MANIMEITTLEEWEELLSSSSEQQILLFKHSTACPVSADAWQEYQTHVAGDERGVATYAFVKVIESRPISNQIAEDLDVTHQSPQVILIKDHEALWHTSHANITQAKIAERLR